MSCQPRSVDIVKNVHDRDRPAKKWVIDVVPGQPGREAGCGCAVRNALGRPSLWGHSGWFKGLVPHPCMEPCPQAQGVCCTNSSPAFLHLGGFTLTHVWGLGELINHTMAALTPKPLAIFSHALDLAEKSLQFLVLLGYLRHDRYRDLVLILSAVRRYH